MSLMLENFYAKNNGKRLSVIIDMGYIEEKEVQNRCDKLLAFRIGRKNFRVEGFARMLVRIPPRKVKAVLSTFPIVAGGTYFGTTHHWKETRDYRRRRGQ